MHAEQKVEATPTDRPIFGLPVDTRILFSNHKGIYKRSIEKHKTKLLRKLGFLANFLDADEKIVFVTTGCSPYTLFERLTIGAVWLILLKRSLFVFTNKRVLHIPTTWNFDYRGSIAQILYQDCRRLHVSKAAGSSRSTTTVGTRSSCISPPATATSSSTSSSRPASSMNCSENPQRNHLCPKCTQVLPAAPSGVPLLRARIQESSDQPDAFRTHPGRRVLLHRASFLRDRRRPGGSLSPVSHPDVPRRRAARRGGGRVDLLALSGGSDYREAGHDLPFEQLPRRVHPEGPQGTPERAGRYRRGKRNNRPLRTPPEPKHRPEEILSVR